MKAIPKEVSDWVENHKGSRKPIHSPGYFKKWSVSKTSACWGQPNGGIVVGDYRIAVCQPTPRTEDCIPVLWFDFIKI